MYKGWNVHANRLFFANALRTFSRFLTYTSYSHRPLLGDPWLDTTVSAEGKNFESTPEQPIAVSDGFHASDLATYYGDVDPTVKAVQTEALKSIHGWLQGFEPKN